MSTKWMSSNKRHGQTLKPFKRRPIITKDMADVLSPNRAQENRNRRLAEIKNGKENMKKLDQLARANWADHSTRMPEPIPHKKAILKPIKVGIPCVFHETDFDQWEATISSHPIQQPPGGFGPLRSFPPDTVSNITPSVMNQQPRKSVAGPPSESRLSLSHNLDTGDGRAILNLDSKFYDFRLREVARPFMATGPIMSPGPRFGPAAPCEHTTHHPRDFQYRPSIVNRDIYIRRKRPSLTQSNLISNSYGVVEVMKQTLPEMVETEAETANVPEVHKFDPKSFQKENTVLLLNRVDKMLNVSKQKPIIGEAASSGSVSGETPNLLDLQSDFSADEYLPEVIPRQTAVIGSDAAADMLNIEGIITGIHRRTKIRPKLKCQYWLQNYVVDDLKATE